MLNGVGLFYCANYKNHWILVSYSVKILFENDVY